MVLFLQSVTPGLVNNPPKSRNGSSSPVIYQEQSHSAQKHNQYDAADCHPHRRQQVSGVVFRTLHDGCSQGALLINPGLSIRNCNFQAATAGRQLVEFYYHAVLFGL